MNEINAPCFCSQRLTGKGPEETSRAEGETRHGGLCEGSPTVCL